MEGYWWEEGRMGEKVQGIRNIIGRQKIRQGEVKNSMGNEGAKELICASHGHELRGREGCWWEGGCRAEVNKGEKKMGTTAIAQ